MAYIFTPTIKSASEEDLLYNKHIKIESEKEVAFGAL